MIKKKHLTVRQREKKTESNGEAQFEPLFTERLLVDLQKMSRELYLETG